LIESLIMDRVIHTRAAMPLALLAIVVAGGCGGKGAGGSCPALPDCGGGDPTGAWTVTNSCSFAAYNKPSVPTVPPDYSVPSQATGGGDWCWSLVINPDGTVANATPAPALDPVTIGVNSINPGTAYVDVDAVNAGTVCFNANHNFVYSLSAVSRNQLYLARSCLGVNGANMTCGALASALTTFFMAESQQYTSFACTPAGEDCSCAFDYSESPGANSAVGGSGTWTAQDGLIWTYLIEGSGNLMEGPHTVFQTDYCLSNGGQMLQLTGYRGTPIMAHAGLRTLTLTKLSGADATMACPQ
jgi:hypothetical protein